MSELELIALAKLAATHRPQETLEIGTFDGRTTLNLAANSAPDAEVYTLDLPRSGKDRQACPWPPWRTATWRKTTPGRATGGPTARRISPPALRGLGHLRPISFLAGTLDFVFIDGSHWRVRVRPERHAPRPAPAAPGGIPASSPGTTTVWGATYAAVGVTPAVDELTRSGEIPGQPRWLCGTSLVVLVLT